MAFQIKQIYFLVSKKTAARKQKRYDTGYALTANGATQRPNRRLLTTSPLPPHRDPDGQYPLRSAASHICSNPPEQMEKGGHIEM